MKSKFPTNVTDVKLGLTHKMIYTGLAVLLLIIGVAGLIIPVIPGILFLVAAIFVFSKVSTRVQRWSEGQAWMHGIRVRMIQMGSLRPLEKARFMVLLGLKSMVSGAETIMHKVRRLIAKKS